MEEFQRLSTYQLQAIGFPANLLPHLFSKLSSKRGEELEEAFQITLTDSDVEGELGGGGGVGVGGWVMKCRRNMEPYSDVFILRHVWTSDGDRKGKSILTGDLSLLQTVAKCLGVPSLGEQRRTALEKITNTVVKMTGKSKIVACKALMESGYDLIAATLKAKELTEEDVMARSGRNREGLLSFEEFKRGLDEIRRGEAGRGGGGGGGGGENGVDKLSDEQVQVMYEDWKERKLREPVRDAENWVQCGTYKWKEEEGEEEGEEDGEVISVSIALPPNTKKKDIKCEITSKKWRFSVNSGSQESVLIDGKFGEKMLPNECFWTLDDGYACVTLQKAGSGGEEGRGEGGGGGGKLGELIVGEVQGEQEVEEEDIRKCVEEIMSRIRESNLTYSAVTSQGEQPQMWYVLEREGEALVHSTSPNFACHPFANCLTGSVVSLLWPIKEVREGDICSRDYAL